MMSFTPEQKKRLAETLTYRCSQEFKGLTWGEASLIQQAGIESDRDVTLDTAFDLGACLDKTEAKAELELARKAEIDAIGELTSSQHESPESLAGIICKYSKLHAAYLAAKAKLENVLALQGS